MAKLIILITDANRGAVYNSGLEIAHVFGRESVVVEEKGETHLTRGESAYVTGPKEAFQKLVAEAGELWITTNPMVGDWQKYVSVEEEQQGA